MKVGSGNYSDLWKAIIRPPREEYSVADLGMITLLFYNLIFITGPR